MNVLPQAQESLPVSHIGYGRHWVVENWLYTHLEEIHKITKFGYIGIFKVRRHTLASLIEIRREIREIRGIRVNSHAFPDSHDENENEIRREIDLEIGTLIPPNV
jgi:hypothetical protein